MVETDLIWAIGRRKQSSAQVRIRPGEGSIWVNSKKFEEYFPSESVRGYAVQPLAVTGTVGQYDIHATIKGGGTIGQSGALRHGLARALAKREPDLKSVLKESGMLTRDSRVKERKKSGQPGARKRFQFSKR